MAGKVGPASRTEPPKLSRKPSHPNLRRREYQLPTTIMEVVANTLVISASFNAMDSGSDRLAISTSFLEQEILDELLEGFNEEHDNDDEDNLSWTSSAASPVSSVGSPVEAKRIRPDLDPLPVAKGQEPTEYFTVDNYVWPTPTKRQCRRMPDELRRQRHRESQREFMTRKRSQFRAMRTEISHLESQLKWLKARQELQALTNEQQSLRANMDKVVCTIQENVWKKRNLDEAS